MNRRSFLKMGIGVLLLSGCNSRGNGSPFTKTPGLALKPASGVSMVRLPKNLLNSAGVLLEDFENINDWTVRSGSIASNTSEVKSGSQSIKATTNSGATLQIDKVVNWDLSNMQRLSLWVYIHDAASSYGGSIQLWLGTDSSFNNAWRVYRSINPGYDMDSGWNLWSFPNQWFEVVAGSPIWSNPIVHIRITIYAAARQVAHASFESLTAYYGAAGTPAIMMRFDDGTTQQYSNAFQYMKQYGIRGTLYMATGLIGKEGYLTAAQLREMDAAGWGIGNHTHSHTNFHGLTVEQMQNDLTNGMNDLNALGLTKASRCVAYPGGGVSYDYPNTMTAMANAEMLTGSTTNGDDNISNLHQPTLLPCTDLYRLPDEPFKTGTISLARAKDLLGDTIVGGGVFAGHWHTIDGLNSEWSTADFHNFIDYVYEKIQAGLITAITIDELYRSTLGSVMVPVFR